MRKVIIEKENEQTVLLESITPAKPIFAVRNGGIVGMIICEERGYILRYPTGIGANGHHPSILKCVESVGKLGFSFVTE